MPNDSSHLPPQDGDDSVPAPQSESASTSSNAAPSDGDAPSREAPNTHDADALRQEEREAMRRAGSALEEENRSIHSLGRFFARGTRPFLLLILVFSLYLAYQVLSPFITTIIFAILIAALAHPMHALLVKRMGGRPNLSALITVTLVTVVILLPLLMVSMGMISQGLDFASKVREWIDAGGMEQYANRAFLDRILLWLEERIPFVDFGDIDVGAGLLQASRYLSEQFLRGGYVFVGNAAALVANFGIMLFITFYLVRDGGEMIKAVKHLSPLRADQEDRIFSKIRGVARSVLLGSLFTALLQGLAAGIGLFIVGVPALFWGAMIGISSLVPVVGTALFWVPITGYLALAGEYKGALFFSLWSMVVVGSIDNFVRPYLMRGEGSLSPFYIFLAIVGGVQVFGLKGLLYGPLALGFAMVMLLIYEEEFRHVLLESDRATEEDDADESDGGREEDGGELAVLEIPDPDEAAKAR